MDDPLQDISWKRLQKHYIQRKDPNRSRVKVRENGYKKIKNKNSFAFSTTLR